MFFVTRAKSLLPIHSTFLQAKGKENPFDKLFFFDLKKLKKVKWQTPKEENVWPIQKE